MKLLLFLSHNGVCSRRKAFDLIRSGAVAVNGTVQNEPSTMVDPVKDKISVEGKAVEIKQYDYILFNKPPGYVTTKAYGQNEKIIYDVLPAKYHHLMPVGRLDKDSEGLLILTNDGDLTFCLTHPSFNVHKTYVAQIGGTLREEKRKELERGVMIEGKKTHPCRIDRVLKKGERTEFQITLHEGRKRQIRLMLQAVGHRVVFLQRISQGGLSLGALKPGEWRELTLEEIRKLKSFQVVELKSNSKTY